jgi:hypothetical protein
MRGSDDVLFGISEAASSDWLRVAVTRPSTPAHRAGWAFAHHCERDGSVILIETDCSCRLIEEAVDWKPTRRPKGRGDDGCPGLPRPGLPRGRRVLAAMHRQHGRRSNAVRSIGPQTENWGGGGNCGCPHLRRGIVGVLIFALVFAPIGRAADMTASGAGQDVVARIAQMPVQRQLRVGRGVSQRSNRSATSGWLSRSR